jgi:deoxyribonuclease-4
MGSAQSPSTPATSSTCAARPKASESTRSQHFAARSNAPWRSAQSTSSCIQEAGRDSPASKVLIENTAGAEFSLGGKLEQVAELVACLQACAPVAVCLDTCHVHVAGYDIVSDDGYIETMKLVEATVGFDAVKVWHCNDAKAAMGSKLDRHEHIGEGTIGAATFRRLLHDARFAHCAFIAETPVDAPGDEARNVGVLRTLAAR